MQVPMGGLTLIGILATIAAASILLGKAAETWDSQVRHELELTLIARGEEYQRAIDQYKQTNGTLPMKLEDLCPKKKADVRYIRRCWKDPITGKEFRLLKPTDVGQRAAMRKQQEEDAEAKSGTGERDRSDDDNRQGPSVSDVKYGMPGHESDIKWSGDQPFVGVASDSDREGFRAWNGSTRYDEWEFVAQTAMVPGANPTNPNGPLNPNNPNLPNGPNNFPNGPNNFPNGPNNFPNGPNNPPIRPGQSGTMGGGMGGTVVPPPGTSFPTPSRPPFGRPTPGKPGFPGGGFPHGGDR